MADDLGHFGFRINNPGNILAAPGAEEAYPGVVGKYSPGNKFTYLQFETPESGLAAIGQTLRRYGKGKVSDIMRKYAGEDNPNYVKSIATAAGVTPDDEIDPGDPSTLSRIIPAIVKFETGKPGNYTPEQYIAAAQAAVSSTKGTRKMPQIPNMLAPQDQTLSDAIQPQPLIRDTPPKDEAEFGQRFSEMASFAQSPSGKAALLQFAVSVLQPQPLGQTGIGHIASAVGQGAAAAGRAQKTEFEERLLTEREKRGARAEERAGRAEERQLAQSEATIKYYTDRARIADEQTKIALERLTKEGDRLAQSERLSLASKLVDGTQKIIKELNDSLLTASKADQPKIQAQIDAHRAKLQEYTGLQERMLKENLGQRGVTTPTQPQARPIPDETFSLGISSPENIGALRRIVQSGARSLTPDQEAKLQAAEKALGVGTREIKPRIMPKDIMAGTEETKPFEAAYTSTGASLYRILRNAETNKPIASMEELRALPKDRRAKIQEELVKALPDQPPKPDDEGIWTDILAHPILALVAERAYGAKVVNEARTRLTSPTSRQQSRGLRKEKLKDIFE